VERYSTVVALISTPVFREAIASSSKFEPGSAELSKQLVFETLRAHALNDYDVQIEVTAASAADCRSAYRTLADRIGQRHAGLSDQNIRLLQAAVDNYRERSIQLKKWADARTQPGYQASDDPDGSKASITAWSETREHLRQLEAVKTLIKPTTFPPETEVYINGPLSNNTVRLSAIAGLAIILSTLVLALGLEFGASKRRNKET
jgi:hypothetical protein